MRLIDADALMEQFAKLQMVILLDSVEEAEIVSMIGNAPTIDPVKHGRWIGIDDYPYETWECDQCGCIYEEMPSWTPNYCPNCGAKMNNGEE